MTDTTSDALVLSQRDGDDIITLTIDRPRFNLLDLELMEQLRGELATALSSGARGVVLTGANGCFCAGLDTRALGTYDDGQRRRTVELLNVLVRDLYCAPVPTVAAVPGHALAGGLIFALACDRRFVTTEPCRLGLPEVQAGVPFPAVPLLVAETELGPRLTRLLALGGEPLDPRQMVAEGTFDAAVAPDGLLNRARAEASTLAGHSAFARIKSQLRGDVRVRADRIISTASDPMLNSWL